VLATFVRAHVPAVEPRLSAFGGVVAQVVDPAIAELEARRDLPRVGHATGPRDEAVRFGQDPTLAFAPADVMSFTPWEKPGGCPDVGEREPRAASAAAGRGQLRVNVLGLL